MDALIEGERIEMVNIVPPRSVDILVGGEGYPMAWWFLLAHGCSGSWAQIFGYVRQSGCRRVMRGLGIKLVTTYLPCRCRLSQPGPEALLATYITGF